MKIGLLANQIPKLIKSNSPEILTALSITGVFTTVYLTGKGAFQASKIINKKKIRPASNKEWLKEQVKDSWKCYVPAGISGIVTIGCIIAASKANSRRTTAAVTAYSLTEKAFNEYKEKVVEQIGKGKEQKIRDELAQDKVSNAMKGSNEVVVLGSGHVLCCELFTGRYFRSDIERLRQLQNEINKRIIGERYITLDEFYDYLGLSHTTGSSNIGWDSDKLMELKFSTTLSENGEPCLAFDYNYTKPLR